MMYSEGFPTQAIPLLDRVTIFSIGKANVLKSTIRQAMKYGIKPEAIVHSALERIILTNNHNYRIR